jgi:RsiW-degrading membrane proteinase PrsW (M82 family)
MKFEQAFGSVLNGTVSGAAVYAFFIVAFIEEICKFLGIRYFAYTRKEFDEPLDGIVYGVMVGMGFATIENILYVEKFASTGLGYQVAFQRMFLSVPAHGTFAVIMGYFVGKAKFDKNNEILFMILGVAGAILFHGTFDFFLFVKDATVVGQQTADGLLVGGALVSFAIALALSRKLIRNHRALSEKMFKDQNTTTTGV